MPPVRVPIICSRWPWASDSSLRWSSSRVWFRVFRSLISVALRRSRSCSRNIWDMKSTSTSATPPKMRITFTKLCCTGS